MILRRVLIRVVVTWGIGIALFIWTEARLLASIVFAIGGILLLTGLVAPRLFRALDHAFFTLGRWVATAVTWILLVPFYFLVFTPGRIVHMCTGKDPMNRQCPTQEPTYWTRHTWKTDPESYHRLF